MIVGAKQARADKISGLDETNKPAASLSVRWLTMGFE
jgi:hypothetical protein